MSQAAPQGREFPRVPHYAWAWFQRSRPVALEAAQRLTGGPPQAGFTDDLRQQFPTDPFVRDVVVGVVADVAFGGRIPARRPPGTSWDRGLLWWAAAIAGVTPAEFEHRSQGPQVAQRRLFDEGAATPEPPRPGPQGRPRRLAPPPGQAPDVPEVGRLAVARALRELLSSADGDQVPVAAVRALLAQVEEGVAG